MQSIECNALSVFDMQCRDSVRGIGGMFLQKDLAKKRQRLQKPETEREGGEVRPRAFQYRPPVL